MSLELVKIMAELMAKFAPQTALDDGEMSLQLAEFTAPTMP